MNDENLVSLATRTERERKEIAKKGQIASTNKKRERKTMREMMQMLLSLPAVGEESNVLDEVGVDNEDKNNKCMVAVGLMKRAMSGDPRAVEVLCGIAGEVFTIDKNEQEENEVKETIQRLGSLEVKFVDASKGENNEDN